MKNWTQLCCGLAPSPLPILSTEEQESLSESPAPQKVAPSVGSSVAGGRLAAAYEKMTADQVKSLTWYQKVLIAQGKSLDLDTAVPTKRGAASTSLTEACREVRKNEGGQ